MKKFFKKHVLRCFCCGSIYKRLSGGLGCSLSTNYSTEVGGI